MVEKRLRYAICKAGRQEGRNWDRYRNTDRRTRY
jgi:hypothetical protein